MKKYLLILLVLYLTQVSCGTNEKQLEKVAYRVVTGRCKCLDSSNIHLSPNATRVLRKFYDHGASMLPDEYDSLSGEEKLEIKAFADSLHSTNTNVSKCFDKVFREEYDGKGINGQIDGNRVETLIFDTAKGMRGCELSMFGSSSREIDNLSEAIRSFNERTNHDPQKK